MFGVVGSNIRHEVRCSVASQFVLRSRFARRSSIVRGTMAKRAREMAAEVFEQGHKGHYRTVMEYLEAHITDQATRALQYKLRDLGIEEERICHISGFVFVRRAMCHM